ncbi:cupin domain-containing protein [Magnetovibrio blakemorei]|uniref:Cupin n=1 Tax=Magnetovibrio blakemorei TaxID=28181 RepID=A0A1E5QC01_9PROT|nr:cupin domain-containing protein [Magnetovibrio blakemorei]OEJ69616.1 cupin [Magnetovibrio blakemorei]
MRAFPGLDADEVITTLGLEPHPEGGHFKEIYRADGPDGGRGQVTTIYFLLKAGEVSHWHRVQDAVEIWCWHGGAALELSIHAEGTELETHVLGLDLQAGQRPQAIVPVNAWQAAKPLGDWTLVGCQVAPAFDFARFELAPPGFEPG